MGLVGYALGGLPATRLLERLGITSSPDTVLRRIKAPSCKRKQPEVRVLGVDDWAWRKGLRYGTMLMNMEQRKVIDLLPDRSTESFEQWLQGHPEVEIITHAIGVDLMPPPGARLPRRQYRLPIVTI